MANMFPRVGQFTESVRKLDATGINFKTFGDARIGRLCSRQRRFRHRIFEQYRQTPLPQIWFDVLDQYLAENVRPGVIVGDPHPLPCRCRQRRPVALALRDG
jgi:hypothetical protein